MFLDVPGALFTVDGVPAGLIGAGEPRLRRSERFEPVAAARVPARPRTTLLGRLLQLAASSRAASPGAASPGAASPRAGSLRPVS